MSRSTPLLSRRVFRVATCVVALSSVHLDAHAAKRTVCFEIKFVDNRSDGTCPKSGDTGVLRPCNTGFPNPNHTGIDGFRYELWDKDGTDVWDDDFIGTFYMSGTGVRCATFEWEAISGGEADPDVYVRLRPEVRGSSSGAILSAVDADGTAYPTISWRNASGGVATNCGTGSNCTIPGTQSGFLVPNISVASIHHFTLLGLDNGQRTLDVFDGAIDDTSTIYMHVDELANMPGVYSSGCAAAGACITGPNDFYMEDWIADAPDVAPHELGHLLQRREMGVGNPGLDYSRTNDGWTPTELEHENAATTEGWAMYVETRSWYDADDSSLGVAVDSFENWFLDLEEASIDPSGRGCNGAAHTPIQVAKAFWDMDDAHNEDGAGPASGKSDGNNISPGWLLNQWDDFPWGYLNRQSMENDRDGRNMRDYAANAPVGDTETFLEMNCMTAQVDN